MPKPITDGSRHRRTNICSLGSLDSVLNLTRLVLINLSTTDRDNRTLRPPQHTDFLIQELSLFLV